ncbi:MAG: hypothetical protein RIA64_00235 [Rhodospirillales bacterium]
MNMLSNIHMQQLDEAGLYAPLDGGRLSVTQAEIDDGVRRARVLRSEAFTRSFVAMIKRLGALLKRL